MEQTPQIPRTPNDMTIKPKGHYTDVETREVYPILVMDEDEIKERLELNIANTSESLRARVLAANSTTNGHSESTSIY